MYSRPLNKYELKSFYNLWGNFDKFLKKSGLLIKGDFFDKINKEIYKREI